LNEAMDAAWGLSLRWIGNAPRSDLGQRCGHVDSRVSALHFVDELLRDRDLRFRVRDDRE
jgi:hypothetical protein